MGDTMVPTSLVELAILRRLMEIERERERDTRIREIAYEDLQEGAIYMNQAYQSWQKAMREGKRLPQSAVDAAVHSAAVSLKFASDMMSMEQAQVLKVKMGTPDKEPLLPILP